MKKNATLSYRGKTYPLTLISFSYSWGLNMAGKTQARQRQVAYPNRIEQSPLSIVIQFYDWKEYRNFIDWIRQYHLYVTSRSNPDRLSFKTNAIRNGVSYLVAVTDAPFKVSYDTTAPRVGLTLLILKDELDIGDSSHSKFTGDMEDLIIDRYEVQAEDITDKGDSAFVK